MCYTVKIELDAAGTPLLHIRKLVCQQFRRAVISIPLAGQNWRPSAAGVTMGKVFARNGEYPDQSRVTRVTSFAERVRWYVHALGVNPLIRITDRLEALAVLAALMSALIAIPAAAQAGNLVYESAAHTADEQAHDRHAVQALVVEGSRRMPTDPEGPAADGPASVRAQWRDGTHMRTEQITSPSMAKAGESLTIWLDGTGKVVAAPMTADDAGLSVAVAAGTVWIAIVACAALAAFLIRRGLDRSRDHAWERELHLLAHNDDGWANRQV
ncbi:MAG: hypothetical protein QOF88_4896 [Mycobacterium sp.]|jgi:hypothetical protein|nr:hypothetical protein [Mycobacterium sp.]